jgi:hypothetical protein
MDAPRGGAARLYRGDGSDGRRGTGYLLVRRLRTLTVGFLTPFYFLHAGTPEKGPREASRENGLSEEG